MGLLDVLTGKVARANKRSAFLLSAPLARAQAEHPQGFLDWFATALAWGTDSLVESLAGEDSSVPEYAALGKAIKQEPLVRLAGYCSWWLHKRTLLANPGIVRNAQGELDDTSRLMLRDMDFFREIMYSAKAEPIVIKAIADDDAMEAALASPVPGEEPNSTRYLFSRVAICDALLGFDAPANYADTPGGGFEKALAIAAAFTTCANGVTPYLELLQKQARSTT